MPIRWPEPFGLVMTEAMACGTPVIAYPEGAAPEIVLDGETGFVVNDESEMAAAVKRLPEIDPHRCRESAAERFDVAAVVRRPRARLPRGDEPAPRHRGDDEGTGARRRRVIAGRHGAALARACSATSAASQPRRSSSSTRRT